MSYLFIFLIAAALIALNIAIEPIYDHDIDHRPIGSQWDDHFLG